MSFHQDEFHQKGTTWEIKGNYVNFNDYSKKELVDLIENIMEDLSMQELIEVGKIIDFWIDERTPKYSRDRITGKKFRDD